MNARRQADEHRADWLHAFDAGRREAGRPPLGSSPELIVALGNAIDAAHDAWPKIPLDSAALAHHIGRVLELEAGAGAGGDDRQIPGGGSAVSGHMTAVAAVASLHTADLLLACAAARGVPEAVAEVDSRYIKPLPFILGSVSALPVDADTVCSILRAKLLVGEPGQPPRIATYGGRAPLGAWIAIAAQRTAISLDRREGALQRAHDRAMAEAIAPDLNPELRHIKARYKDAVEAAFKDALGELPVRDRALLRLGLVGGLSLEAIAASYNVNASTVSRWLAKVRQGLLDRTLELMRQRLRLSDPEAASIARLVTSQIDISVVRFL
jgi:RNA polymerase sigma-70 factor (ECF subfamily)